MLVCLELDYPPTWNHLHSFVRGRPVLSREARAYRQHVRSQVRNAGVPVLWGLLATRIDLYPPDCRRRDCDNAQKPIQDAIQQAGLFLDDSQIIWLLTVRHPPQSGGKAGVRLWPLASGPLPDEFLQLPQFTER